jgi:hypothetical protein
VFDTIEVFEHVGQLSRPVIGDDEGSGASDV